MPNTNDSKKYISLKRLSEFLENLKGVFASSSHEHKLSDITDYTIDDALSDSENPVQNKVINEEFNEVSIAMLALEGAIDEASEAAHAHDNKYYLITEIDSKLNEKADKEHLHSISDIETLESSLDEKASKLTAINGKTLEEDITLTPEDIGAANFDHIHEDYYTNTEIDSKFEIVNTSISNIESGKTVVPKASHAINADDATNAVNAVNATHDSASNIIVDTYETKADAIIKLNDAKSYADGIKDDLLNGAGEAYDTLKDLGLLIDENTDAIDALELVAAGKADKEHTHDDAYYKKAEVDNMEFITIDDIDSICGSSITAATLSEVTF